MRTFANVTPGAPLKYEVGQYQLSLVIDRTLSDDYVLTVTLTPVSSPEQVMINGTFAGRTISAHDGPLEFSLEQQGVRVSGVMALSSIK